MYNAPRAFVLWFFLVLMLSVYMWGYFQPAYIRRSNVSLPAGLGRYRYNERTIAIRSSTVCFCHPTSEEAPTRSVPARLSGHDITSGQVPKSSGSTRTQRPWCHLSSHQRAWFPCDIGRLWKIPHALISSGILGTTILDFNCIDWKDFVFGQQIVSLANKSGGYSQRIK